LSENPEYIHQQLISYRGNKRNLLPLIAQGLGIAISRLGKPKLTILDAFSGSGVCSRFFKRRAELLIANDLQPYATALAECYLTNRSTVDLGDLALAIDYLEKHKLDPQPTGFIERLYAPDDDNRIKEDERAFFTSRNARILDNVCRLLKSTPPQHRRLILGPLLAEASIRSNTAGHFKGFLKDKNTGIGAFGGSTADKKWRIEAPITLTTPVLSNFECDYRVHREDANELVKTLDEVDVAYYDPPCGVQGYGLLYFMLNLIVQYEEPRQISRVSGVPKNWVRSGYIQKYGVCDLFAELIRDTPAKFILASYSNEGSISQDEMEMILAKHGSFTMIEQPYRRYSSSHQVGSPTKVLERLYVLEKR